MDQAKIGKFIAEQRKSQKLTQMQLAEKLGVTDRAVSKWENGRAMPDSAVMLELCKVLNVSVNELFIGERIQMEEYNAKTEKLLVDLVKQKEQTDKKMLTLETIITILSLSILAIALIVTMVFDMKEWVKLVICAGGIVQFAIFGIICIRIEQVSGYYQCSKCGHKYVPKFKEVIFSQHLGRTRYLRCPNCGKRSWQKKVISKD